MNTLNKQTTSLPPVAAYITQVAIDTATSDVWEILSTDFATLSPDGKSTPMSRESLHQMEYPEDSNRFDSQPPEWTQLDEASIDAGKYIIFDYILSEPKKVTHQKEIEIENLFENFIVWTLEDYEKFCELIEALSNTTGNETSFRESLLGYLEDYSGFGKEPNDM